MALGAPARATALGAAVVNVLLGAFAFVYFDGVDAAGGAYQFAGGFTVLDDPEIRFAVGLDGISLVMVILTVLVTFCAVWVSPEKIAGSERLFYVSALLISAGALGAFCSTDLFFFYAFHELALIPTFLMIGIWGTGDRKAAAWKITIYLGLGSVVLLAGLVALFLHSGGATFDIAAMKQSIAAEGVPAETQAWIFALLLAGFGILVSLFPFHSWAAPAYASAPTPTTMLHAGVLKKFGLYGLLRVAVPMLPEGAQADWIHTTLLVLLLGNILYVGFVTLAQRDLDLMLGNSSVMHMGYIFLGIASYNAIGISGAVLLMFAHGISIALLFALSGTIRESSGTLTMSRLGGFGKAAPFLGLVFGMAAFASIGLPGFANFASEIMIFLGAFSGAGTEITGLQIATILALWGVVISAVYMLRAYRDLFQGESGERAAPGDLSFAQRLPVIILLAALVALGFFPNAFLDKVKPGIELIAQAFA